MTGELFTAADLGAAPPPPRRAARMRLAVDDAAGLYRAGHSACVIAAAWKLTRAGVEGKIRAADLEGLTWCAVHRVHEELHH